MDATLTRDPIWRRVKHGGRIVRLTAAMLLAGHRWHEANMRSIAPMVHPAMRSIRGMERECARSRYDRLRSVIVSALIISERHGWTQHATVHATIVRDCPDWQTEPCATGALVL